MKPRSITASNLILTLDLEPHGEGGFFRRTYQAGHRDMLETTGGPRYLMTSIYYLLTEESPVGQFHFNQSDILHYFHLGDPIEYSLIHADGSLQTLVMGSNVLAGQQPQLHVPGGIWKASGPLREMLEIEMVCATELTPQHFVTCNVYYVKCRKCS